MEKGKVRWFNKHFRYGFIAGKDGEDVFFHQGDVTTIAGKLAKGQVVEYECHQTDRGMSAKNVQVVQAK